jgi:hypothetical protein
MTTLPTIDTIQSRIIELPGRPPAMLAADLAEFYGVTTFQIGRAMKRNLDRFPDDFVFTLTEAEKERLWHQNGGTSQGSRTDLQPLAFTEGGAWALSGVLKSPRAAEVSVMVFRVFTGLVQEGRRTLHGVASRYRVQRVARDPVARLVFPAVAQGLDFAAIRKAAPKSWTTGFLVQGIHDMVLFGEIAELPAGTPAPALAGSGLGNGEPGKPGTPARALAQTEA